MARVLLAALACLISLALEAAPVDELRGSIDKIQKIDRAFVRDEATDARELEAPVAALSKIIDEAPFNESGMAVARYWRGRATELANWLRLRERRPADPDLARQTLADYEWVIGFGRDNSAAGLSIANTLYRAGRVQYSFLGLFGEAYGHWQRCARLEHAGCVNLIATAKLTGEGKVALDVAGSVELHKKVYETGTDYTCAGSFSALAIAEAIYFGGLKDVTVTALDWLQRANGLLAQVDKEKGADNICGRPRFLVAEYLMRLDAGENRPALLEMKQISLADADEKAMLDYLAGKIDEPAFRRLALSEKSRDGACRMLFTAYWLAEIRKDRPLSDEYRRRMDEIGSSCGLELALARLKYGR
jgi:hypothetical protein